MAKTAQEKTFIIKPRVHLSATIDYARRHNEEGNYYVIWWNSESFDSTGFVFQTLDSALKFMNTEPPRARSEDGTEYDSHLLLAV